MLFFRAFGYDRHRPWPTTAEEAATHMPIDCWGGAHAPGSADIPTPSEDIRGQWTFPSESAAVRAALGSPCKYLLVVLYEEDRPTDIVWVKEE